MRQDMRAVYLADDAPAFLDTHALPLLAEARAEFRRLELHACARLPWGRDTMWFSWVGDRVLGTLQLMLRDAGLDAAQFGAVRIDDRAPDEVRDALRILATAPAPDPRALAGFVATKHVEKHHVWPSGSLWRQTTRRGGWAWRGRNDEYQAKSTKGDETINRLLR